MLLVLKNCSRKRCQTCIDSQSIIFIFIYHFQTPFPQKKKKNSKHNLKNDLLQNENVFVCEKKFDYDYVAPTRCLIVKRFSELMENNNSFFFSLFSNNLKEHHFFFNFFKSLFYKTGNQMNSSLCSYCEFINHQLLFASNSNKFKRC